MFLKALQDSRKKVPTLSLALYPSERAIMIGRLLIEPSFTDDERVAAPSNEGHSCGTVCPACSLHLNLLSPSTPPGIRYKHVTALSWHRPEQVVQLFTPPSCPPRRTLCAHGQWQKWQLGSRAKMRLAWLRCAAGTQCAGWTSCPLPQRKRSALICRSPHLQRAGSSRAATRRWSPPRTDPLAATTPARSAAPAPHPGSHVQQQ